MHPIILPLAELRPALIGLGKIVNRNTSLAVLQCLRIERTTDGRVCLTATDLERFVTVQLEQPAEGEPLVLLAHYEDLCRLAKACAKDDQLLLEPGSAKSLKVRFALATQVGEGKIKSLPVEDYPVVPKIEGTPVPLPEAVRSALHEAMECTSKDASRFILQGVCLDVSQPNGHYVVGTDGKHLYSANSFHLPLSRPIIIPRHKFLVWRDFNLDGDWQLKLPKHGEFASPDQRDFVQISSRRWRFITRLLEGNYPNWKQVLPDTGAVQTSILLEPGSLDNVIRSVELLADHDDQFHTIGLEWRDGEVRFVFREAPETSWITCPVPGARGKGKDVIVFCNRQLLIKALRFGLHTIGIIDELTPLRFSHGGRQMIIMPVRVEAGPRPQPAAPPSRARESRAPVPEPLPPRIPIPMNPTPDPIAPPMETPASPSSAPRVEDALELVETLRDTCIKTLAQLKDLSGKLRLIQRGQRSSEREIQSVRHTLRSLQGVRL